MAVMAVIEVELLSTAGWMPAIVGMRNPLDSWDRIDSEVHAGVNTVTISGRELSFPNEEPMLGPNDVDLMCRLLKPGTADHCKFRRQISVWLNVKAPIYWWKEWDTYKVGTTANSTSTMHTVMRYPFELDMLSHDGMTRDGLELEMRTVRSLNLLRERWLEAEDDERKVIWETVIRCLPMSWNQTRTVSLNYEVLANMVRARRNHKQREWREFVSYVRSELPCPWIFDPTLIPEGGDA